MEKKITKIDRFNELKAIPMVAENADLMAFIDHEIELLQKKSANKKMTKAQEENLSTMDKIVEVLGTFEKGATASEVLASDETFKGMSNQKISALLKKLVESERVVKTTDNKKSIFSVA